MAPTLAPPRASRTNFGPRARAAVAAVVGALFLAFVALPATPVAAACAPPPPPPPVGCVGDCLHALGSLSSAAPSAGKSVSIPVDDCNPVTPPHGPGDGSNDPGGLPGTSPTAATASCSEKCSVSTQLADALAVIDAVDERPPSSFVPASTTSRDHAVLFAERNGGFTKPECPGYRTTFTDWVQFGFQDAARGSTYRKTAIFTGRHPTSHGAAAAEARDMQICFEAPYQFANRTGYQVSHDGLLYDGVLPECKGLAHSRTAGATQTPCVLSRQVVRSGNGWVVKIKFNVPASRQDPKALG